MTKEAALYKAKHLRKVHPSICIDAEDFWDTVIAALEQEPCDAVSRKEVMNMLHNHAFDYATSTKISALLKTMRGEVDRMPSVTPAEKVGRWIPVSERLPEVMDGSNGECSDDVLICVADDEWITISTGFYGYYPRSKSQQGWWSMWAYGCHQLDRKYKVVAWMPLPEPYKASPTGAEGSEE